MINYDAARGVSVATAPGPKTQSALAIRSAAPQHSGNYSCRAPNTEPAHIFVYVSEGSRYRSRLPPCAVPPERSVLETNAFALSPQVTRWLRRSVATEWRRARRRRLPRCWPRSRSRCCARARPESARDAAARPRRHAVLRHSANAPLLMSRGHGGYFANLYIKVKTIMSARSGFE